MNQIRYLCLVVSFILLVPFVQASINADVVVDNSFILDDFIFFDYILESDEDITLSYLPHINCPTAPVAPLIERSIDLKANKPYYATYNDQYIKDFFESQTCTAYIEFIDPEQETISKTFKIIMDPSFGFNLLSCKDNSCKHKAKIFKQTEDMYLDYESELDNISINAFLTYPDKSKNKISLPIKLKADEIGTYILEVSASKQDYKTIEKDYMFGVIADYGLSSQISDIQVSDDTEPIEINFNQTEDSEPINNTEDNLIKEEFTRPISSVTVRKQENKSILLYLLLFVFITSVLLSIIFYRKR